MIGEAQDVTVIKTHTNRKVQFVNVNGHRSVSFPVDYKKTSVSHCQMFVKINLGNGFRLAVLQILLILILFHGIAMAADAGKPTPQWIEKIEKLAPETAAVEPKETRNALIFSLMTGYKHKVTPYTVEIVKILGRKSGAYKVQVSDDVAMFEPENIKQFDIVILNNTCSDRSRRNMFWDVIKDEKKALMLEKSLRAHIAKGNGLVAIHGAIVMQNKSPEFSDMLGGSFHFHPKQQVVTGMLVDPKHPIVRPFDGKPLVHKDEPYLFNNAYAEMNFRPLLEMDTSKIEPGKKMDVKTFKSTRRYIAWIKKYGKGRVFYCSPSHNFQSYENPALLRFVLNGIQYAAGDLECDDSPIRKEDR